MNPILYLIVPCYNEELVLPKTYQVLCAKIQSMIAHNLIAPTSAIVFVDDGSKDQTWKVLNTLLHNCPPPETDFVAHCHSPRTIALKLSTNKGHQNALLAGLEYASTRCDCAISIDCDLQDDIDVLESFIQKFLDGSEVVYGVRKKRQSDSGFKKYTALGFYKLMNLMGVKLIYNHADYRLISSRVLKEFANFKEVNLFLRGMIPLVGFKSTIVYYERHERIAGESHYPLSKMFHLAFDGITSLSVKPIQMITVFGFIVSFISFLGIIWAILSSFFGLTVSGWTSLVCVICFIGGIQLLSLGVIGEYIGKIYMEVKHRPRYIISERTQRKDDSVE